MICMAAPFPSSSRMDAWPQRRGLQTVSISRTVFLNELEKKLTSSDKFQTKCRYCCCTRKYYYYYVIVDAFAKSDIVIFGMKLNIKPLLLAVHKLWKGIFHMKL